MDSICTLDDVKHYLDIPSSSTTADAILTDLIAGVSAYALNQSNMPDREDGEDPTFFEDDYLEHYDGTNSQTLLLRHSGPTCPVTTVRAVTVDDTPIPKSTGARVPGFTFDRFAVYLRTFKFCKGHRNVVVRYTAGVDPSSATGQALKSGAAEWVALIYKTRPHIDIRAKTLDRETISFVAEVMPVRMAAVLENLKVRVAA